MSHPTKHNRLPCLTEVKHLVQNLHSDGMVQCKPLESLQGTQGVHAKEVALPRLLPNAQKSLVDGVRFNAIHSLKAVLVVFEKLVFLHKGTAS
jgi:hypothetical protein